MAHNSTWIGYNDTISMDISIDGQGLPETLTLMTAVLREDSIFSVPLLDLLLVDTTESLNVSTVKIKDGTLIDFSISYNNNTINSRQFKIAKIIPIKMRKQVIYKISCYFNSYLLYHNKSWFFTGTSTDAIVNIIENDIQKDVEVFTNFDDSSVNTFKKYKNESFARYLRKTLLPSFKQKNSNHYFLYYHDGFSCQVMDASLLMQDFIDAPTNYVNSTNFSLSAKNIIRYELKVSNFSDSMDKSAYGAKFYQYDIDSGEYILVSNSKTNVVGNPNIDQNIKDEKILLSGTYQGNHVLDYTESYLNNIRSEGLYNIKLTVQLNFDCGVNGLEIIPFKYADGTIIPFILVGKSTVFRNNSYEQHLSLITNTINSDTITSLFNFS